MTGPQSQVYTLIAVSAVFMLGGFALFMGSFGRSARDNVATLRWAWLMLMLMSGSLAAAGAIMWDALDWPK